MRRERTTRKVVNTATLQQLISEKCEMLLRDGKPSYLTYLSLCNNITAMFGIVPMSDVNPGFCNEWKERMVKAGISNSTIALRFSLLKSIFNYAVYKGYARPEDYPFQRKSYEIDKVKIPKIGKRTEAYLTRDEMTRLYRHFMYMKANTRSENAHKMYLGLFLCSYLCNGANVIDLMQLKYDKNWQRNGKRTLSFVRHKVEERTGAKVIVPIIEPLKNVLDFIGRKPQIDGYVLSGLFNDGYDFSNVVDTHRNSVRLCSQVKKLIKPITSEVIGLNNVSMTFARHSYSTVLHHLGAPHYLVEQNMGHACTDVAFNYIGATPIEKLFEVNNMLLDL